MDDLKTTGKHLTRNKEKWKRGLQALVLLMGLSMSTHAQDYEWAAALGGTSYEDSRSTTTDAAGNVYVTGFFTGTADFDPSPGTANLTSGGIEDIFLTKYDASGNYLWAHAIGGSSNDKGYSVAVDGSGNVYVTGFFTGTVDFDPTVATANLTSVGAYDIFLAKYDASGNYLWANSMGGSSYDFGQSVAVDGSGNVYVTGFFTGTADFDPSAATANLSSAGNYDYDIFLAKYEASGNYLWAHAMGGSFSDQGHSVAVDGNGNAFITGAFRDTADFDPAAGTANLTPVGANDIFLAKYDASGNYLWAHAFASSGYDGGHSVAVDSSGNVFITGYFFGTADFDPSVATANLSSAGNYDIFLAKYDASGNYLWAHAMGGRSSDQGHSVAVDGSGNAFITGNFVGTADFDPSAATANLYYGGGADIFLATYDASGNYLWAHAMGGISTDIGYSVAVDGSGNAFITGTFRGPADFDPSAATANLTSAGSNDIFLAKYSGPCQPDTTLLVSGSCDSISVGVTQTTLTNAGGCDSLVIDSVFLYPSYTVYDTVTTCQGQGVFLAGNYQYWPNTYRDDFYTANYCDSTVFTTLLVDPVDSSSASETICPGDSLYVGGGWQKAPGVYTDIYTAANGCDSTVKTTLSVFPANCPGVNDGYIYFSTLNGSEVYSAPMDGSSAPVVIHDASATGNQSLMGMEYLSGPASLYWATGYFNSVKTGSSDGSGSPSELSNSKQGSFTDDIALDPAHNRFFYTGDGQGLYSANLDGSGTAVQIDAARVHACVEYDSVNNKLYYIDYNQGISRANPDGTGKSIIYPGTRFSGLDLDPANDKMYIIDRDNSLVLRGNLDGTATLDTLYDDTGLLFHITLDQQYQQLYYGSYEADDRVITAPADGSGTPIVLYHGYFGNDIRGITIGSGIPECATTFDTLTVTATDSLVSPSGRYTWYSSGAYQDTLMNGNGCNSVITTYLTVEGISSIVMDCPGDQNVIGNTDSCSAMVTYNMPTATDTSFGSAGMGYSISNPAYQSYDMTGATYVGYSDDHTFGPVSLPFSFEFYGTAFNEVYASTNGFISFNAVSSGCCSGRVLPQSSYPNTIFAAWSDWVSDINYKVFGSMPNRVVVFSINGPAYSGGWLYKLPNSPT